MKLSKEYIAGIRNEYISKVLNKEEVMPNPFEQFDLWMEEAIEAKVNEVTAVHISTASKEGRPAGRIMLLKGYDQHGFLFYTNYHNKLEGLFQDHFLGIGF